jgi:hypothetical protein
MSIVRARGGILADLNRLTGDMEDKDRNNREIWVEVSVDILRRTSYGQALSTFPGVSGDDRDRDRLEKLSITS